MPEQGSGSARPGGEGHCRNTFRRRRGSARPVLHTLAQRELERLVAVATAVELSAVQQGANVVHCRAAHVSAKLLESTCCCPLPAAATTHSAPDTSSPLSGVFHPSPRTRSFFTTPPSLDSSLSWPTSCGAQDSFSSSPPSSAFSASMPSPPGRPPVMSISSSLMVALCASGFGEGRRRMAEEGQWRGETKTGVVLRHDALHAHPVPVLCCQHHPSKSISNPWPCPGQAASSCTQPGRLTWPPPGRRPARRGSARRARGRRASPGWSSPPGPAG